ncbi:MAG: hypothetical protein J6S30_00500 [Kiritimatiellae bacterium]|nr:hypothetical protein [Kiritimatiellia bacterium]
MLDISLFDTILVVLCAVLVTALAAILWWCIAGERVKEIWRGWLALPLLWKIVLPVVFGAFVLHGSVKRGEVVGEGVGDSCSGRKAGGKSTLQLQLNTTTTTPSLLQSSTVSDEDIARGYRLESANTSKAGAA